MPVPHVLDLVGRVSVDAAPFVPVVESLADVEVLLSASDALLEPGRYAGADPFAAWGVMFPPPSGPDRLFEVSGWLHTNDAAEIDARAAQAEQDADWTAARKHRVVSNGIYGPIRTPRAYSWNLALQYADSMRHSLNAPEWQWAWMDGFRDYASVETVTQAIRAARNARQLRSSGARGGVLKAARAAVAEQAPTAIQTFTTTVVEPLNAAIRAVIAEMEER